MLGVGVSQGTMFGVGAVYARNAGMGLSDVSLFMAVVLFGGLALQWPVGWLSDHFDRRRVLTAVTFLAAAAALVAGLLPIDVRFGLFIAMATFGGMSQPLYSLCIAHTNDYLKPEQIVAASGSLVLVAGVGLSFGPMLTATMMHLHDISGFFWSLAATHAFIGLFALWRMTRRNALPLEDQGQFVAMAPRSSPVAAGLAHETT